MPSTASVENPISARTSLNLLLKFTAFAMVVIFLLGFVFSPVGAWTGPLLATWLIGTQKPRRGFLLLFGLAILLNLLFNFRPFLLTGIANTGWNLLALLLGLLPYLLYRLTTQRRQGFLLTLSLPLWSVALLALARVLLPIPVFGSHFVAPVQSAFSSVPFLAENLGVGAGSFLICWFAAALIWAWNLEFRFKDISTGVGIFAAICLLVIGDVLFEQIFHAAPPDSFLTRQIFAIACFLGALILLVWSFFQPDIGRKSWAEKTATLAILRSPSTGASLQVVTENGREILASESGERFPIRDGIPIFMEPQKLTGSNQKYNRLYETIGGFYDDIQRVVCALRGVSPAQYFLGYLRFLEVKPGDSVLETSVGTGLNFKYLPRGVKLFGLDLSAEMLTNCQSNLRRWNLDADLILGNAEDLPFANDCFDVVFHVGGINFFNDRAKAIREMIRVAKPCTRILIADETEEHVKKVYERSPVTSSYFKNRSETVTAPTDFVPPEMQEVHLELIRNGLFYVLTFRKPCCGPAISKNA